MVPQRSACAGQPSSTTAGGSRQSGCAERAGLPQRQIMDGRSHPHCSRGNVLWHSLPACQLAVLSALRVLAVAVQLRHCTGTCAIIAAVFGAGPRVTLAALVCTLACSALLCHFVLLFGSWGTWERRRSAFEMQRSGLNTRTVAAAPFCDGRVDRAPGLTADVHSGRRLVHSFGILVDRALPAPSRALSRLKTGATVRSAPQ